MNIVRGIASSGAIVIEKLDELRDITLKEWNEYEWHDATPFSSMDRIFIRGKRLISEPCDGFVYIEVSRPGDAEQRWVRAKTFLPKED